MDNSTEIAQSTTNPDNDLAELAATDERVRMRVALEQTLGMATAETSSQLLSRTLAAACAVTGARVAFALEPGGKLRSHGDPVLAANLAALDLRLVEPGNVAAAATPTQASPPVATHTPVRLATQPPIQLPTQPVSSARWSRPGVLAALRSAGLPYARTAGYDETLIAVASPTDLVPDAEGLLALLVAQARAIRARLTEVDQLSRQAESDPLTGLRHTRPFARRLDASSPGRTAIIAVDVDDFKRVNDEHGHQAGDHALVSLVDALRSAMRGDDQLYRIGGDEFAVIVDVNSPAEVSAIARRLLEAARQTGQTVSVGAALHMVGETGKDTLGRADKALYQAKRAGRDTARLAGSRTRVA